jgi:hypothetical protein
VDLGGDLVRQIPERERRVEAYGASRAAPRDGNQVQVRAYLGVRQTEDPTRKLDEETLVTQGVQLARVDAGLDRISGLENASRTSSQVF